MKAIPGQLESEKDKAIPSDVAAWVASPAQTVYKLIARLAYRVASLQFDWATSEDIKNMFPSEPVPVDMTPIIYGSFVIDTTASNGGTSTQMLRSLVNGSGATLNGGTSASGTVEESAGTSGATSGTDGENTSNGSADNNSAVDTTPTINPGTTVEDVVFTITADELKAKILAGLADGTITNKTVDENPKVHEVTDHSMNRYTTIETTGGVSATFFLMPVSRFAESAYKIESCTPITYTHNTITNVANSSEALAFIDNDKVTYNGKEYILAACCNDAEETGTDIDYIISRK